MVDLKLTGEFKAAPPLQGEIDQSEVGVVLGNSFQRAGYILGFTADGEVRFVLEKLPQATAHDRVVVDEEDGMEVIILRHKHYLVSEYAYLYTHPGCRGKFSILRMPRGDAQVFLHTGPALDQST